MDNKAMQAKVTPALSTQAARPLQIVILGLSITSSWGNGHATTYRALVRALERRGHQVLFLERDVPWYAANRDLPRPPYGRTLLYQDLAELKRRFQAEIQAADLVIVGSYVPEGVAVGEWVTQCAQGITAFYDIDTPVTLAKLERGDYEYLTPALIARYQLYLSFTGGPVLAQLEQSYGSPAARPLYCSVDPDLYYPEQCETQWALGYMGTYSADRRPGLEALLLTPARRAPHLRFVVAGPNYPAEMAPSPNVTRIEHLPPDQHRAFYNAQTFTLNLTRADMVKAGYAPSVRLFEAAACGTPIISDYWAGLETFFALGSEILVADSAHEVLTYVHELTGAERQAIGHRARANVLHSHTAAHRAQQLEIYIASLSRGERQTPVAESVVSIR
ncbi:MAG: glycosyltransferase [Caldilineaceae bacterium]